MKTNTLLLEKYCANYTISVKHVSILFLLTVCQVGVAGKKLLQMYKNPIF